MPNIKTIRAGIAELPNGPPLVVVLTGGTTGIGSYTAKALATTFAKQGYKLRVYIVGRNTENAEALLKNGRAVSPGSDWRFVRAGDLSLLSDVDRVCKDIIAQEEKDPFAGGPARLDVLYMSQAMSPLQESKPTNEGIDAQMSLLYYSRMRFIQNFTPLLEAAGQNNPAHVVSIFAGGSEDATKPDEILIGTPPPAKYGVTSVRKHTAFMKTIFFERLAEQHAGRISFTHIFPGLVDGPTFYSAVNPLWFLILWRIMKPLISWYITPPDVCGEVMVYLATARYAAKGTVKAGDGEKKIVGGVAYSTQRELGGGAYSVGQRGDENKEVSYAKLRKSDTAQKVWDHTTKTIAETVSGNATTAAASSS